MPPPDPPPADPLAALQAHLAGLPRPEVLFCDLDGTLLGRGGSLLADADGRPDLTAARALVAAAADGLDVVPVSGRRAGQLAVDARLLGLPVAVAEAGGVVLRDGAQEVRWGECPRDLGPTPRAALAAVDAPAVLARALGGALEPHDPWDEGRTTAHLLRGRVDVRAADRALAEAGVAWARLVDNGPVGGGQHAYHLLPRGIGKAVAVADELARRGLGAAQAAAVGDSAEDATLARVVGTCAVVAGGPAGAGVLALPGRAGAGVAQLVEALLARRGAA